MRIPIILVICLLAGFAGCADPGEPAHDSFQDAPRYWRMMAATEAAPLAWNLHWMPGLEPPDSVQPAVAEQLNLVFGAEATHFLGGSVLDVESDGIWESAELYALGAALRQQAGELALPIAFLDGRYAREDEGTVFYGVESNGVAFVFPERVGHAWVGEAAVPHTATAEILRSVAVHEMGHALGLVGREAAMLHPRLAGEAEDPCQCHSRLEDSVMYYVLETEGWYEEIIFQDGRAIPYEFDEYDLADLRHARQLALERYRG